MGDSKAVLDLGGQFLEVTPEHRVQHHLAEQDRLKKAGTYLAPIRSVALALHSVHYMIRVGSMLAHQ